MKPAKKIARTLPPAAMPAMAGVERGVCWPEDEGVSEESVLEAFGGGTTSAVVVRVTVDGGRVVKVMVDVIVIVTWASRTLPCVSRTLLTTNVPGGQ